MAIGTILASAIGGYFPRITDRYPKLGQTIPILDRYPYLLPCLVAAIFPLVSGLVAWIWMEETLPPKAKDMQIEGQSQARSQVLHAHPHTTVHYSSTDEGDTRVEGAADHHNTGIPPRDIDDQEDDAPVSFRDLLTPDINALMTSFGLLQLQGISFLGLLPLFCFTPVPSGGLSFSSGKIGLAMSIRGVSTIAVQLFAFPWLSKRIGTVKLYKVLVILFIPAFVLLPLCNVMARSERDVWVWIGLSGSMGLYAIGNMAFGTHDRLVGLFCLSLTLSSACNLIMVNDAAPNRRSLGAINGWSQAVSSLMRAIGPGSSSALFALSVDKRVLEGQLIWVVLSALSVVSAMAALMLKNDHRKV